MGDVIRGSLCKRYNRSLRSHRKITDEGDQDSSVLPARPDKKPESQTIRKCIVSGHSLASWEPRFGMEPEAMLSSDTSDLRAFVSGKRRRVAADPARTRIHNSSVRKRFLQQWAEDGEE
jgi:hypothetical protein